MATSTNKPAALTKVVTPKDELVRFSYAHVFEPESVEDGGEKKYSCALLIDKRHKKTLKLLKDAIEAAKTEGAATLGNRTAGIKLPLRDGDDERPDDEAYTGMYFMNATSKTRPGVVDADKLKITSPDERSKTKGGRDYDEEGISTEDFYSGSWGRASIRFYAFNRNGNKGIAVGLNNLQKIEDGEALAGMSSAAEDFGDDDDDDGMLD